MKQTLKRSTSLGVSLVLALSALAVWTPGKALAATRTWDGGGSDNLWSTAANWSSDTAPVNGDTVAFDLTVATDYDEEIENDIEGLSLAGITLSGAGELNKSFEVTGNALTLAGAITQSQESGRVVFNIDITLGANLTVATASDGYGVTFGKFGSTTLLDLSTYSLTYNLTGSAEGCENATAVYSGLKGSGNLTITSGLVELNGAASSYTGSVVINDGGLSIAKNALGAANAITVNGSSLLKLSSNEATTFAMPVTMNSSGNPALVASFGGFGCKGGVAPDKSTTTLSGSLTLSQDTIFDGDNDLNVTGTFISNGHTLSVKDGSSGTVTTSEGTVEPEAKTVTIGADDKDPGKYESVGNKQTYIIDGERGGVTVGTGGILKGTGKVQSVYAMDGSRVAPGHSPGRMTVLETLSLEEGSTYEVELLNKDDYDQFIVGENYASGGNAVMLNNATLEGLIVDGFSIGASDTFTIINNLSDTDVSGTFKDLPEGATFQISDGVFKITYVGGDGNDVVLSVVSVPTVPSTGFRLMFANPAVILAATIVAAGALFYLTRRFSLVKLGTKS